MYKKGLIPIIFLASLIGLLTALDPLGRPVFNPPNVVLAPSLLLAMVGIAIIVISAKSYLSFGYVNLLFLGNAFLAGGLASLISIWQANYSTNYSETIYYVGFLAASIMQLAAALSSQLATSPSHKRKTILKRTYFATAASFVALTALTLLNTMPPFFTAEGPTLIRQVIVATVILLLALGCLIFFWTYTKSKSLTLYWYSLALGLFTLGFFSFALQTQVGDIFNWLGRISHYTGAFYFLAAIRMLSAVKSDASISEKWSETFRSNRAQFDALFANMVDGFSYNRIVLGKSGEPVDYVTLEVNKAYTQITGMGKEVLGRSALESPSALTNDLLSRIAVLGKVALTGEPEKFEFYTQRTQRWFSVTAYSVEKGYFAMLLEDITERKNDEAQIQQLTAHLKEYANNMETLANKRLEELRDAERLSAIGATAGMVGHDLRNPLQAIEGAVYLLREEVDVLPENAGKQTIKEMLETIGEQTQYMNKIVSDLQDLVRPIRPQLEEIDVKKIIDGALSITKIPENVKLEIIIGDHAQKISVDPRLMIRVLNNLLTNAAQAMSKGGKLTISALKKDDFTLLSISDTGEGISDEARSKLFTPLFTTRSKGQGFGLAICKRVVEAHGGEITFESEVGKGTTFTVKIPISG